MNRKEFLKWGIFGLGAMGVPRAFSNEKADISVIELKGRTVKASKIKLDSGTSLIGPGKVMFESGDEELIIKGKNIYILNITFEAKKTKQQHDSVLRLSDGCENITIENCSFIGDRYCVINADINSREDKKLRFKTPAQNIKFLKNNVKGFSRHLYFHSVHGALIEGNTFMNSMRDSIRLRQNVKKTSITNNKFKKIGSGSKESSDAIDAYWSGEELIITGNHIDGCDSHGLDIKGLSPDKEGKTSKVIINSNIIQNCRYSGILLSSGAYVKGRENFIDSIIVSDNIIQKTNLKKENPNDAGVFVRHGVRGIIIKGNEIRPSFGHGIVLGNFEDRAEQTKNVTISENQVGIRTKDAHCLVSLGADNVMISNNIFKSPKGVKALMIKKKYRNFKAKQVVASDNIG